MFVYVDSLGNEYLPKEAESTLNYLLILTTRLHYLDEATYVKITALYKVNDTCFIPETAGNTFQ